VRERKRKGGRKGREGADISRDLASASPPSDPTADPFQVPIINSIRQMHASVRTEYVSALVCSYSQADILIKRKAMRTCTAMRDKTP